MAQRGQLHAFAGHFADRMLDAVAKRWRACASRPRVGPCFAAAATGRASACRWSMSTRWIATVADRNDPARDPAFNQYVEPAGTAPGRRRRCSRPTPCHWHRRPLRAMCRTPNRTPLAWRCSLRCTAASNGRCWNAWAMLTAPMRCWPSMACCRAWHPYLARSSSTRRIITQSVGGGRTTQPAKRSAAPLTGWNGSAPAGSWSNLVQDAFNDAGTPGAATAGVTTSTGSAA